MKTTIISAIAIGIASAAWIFGMHLFGISTKPTSNFTPVELTATLIPLIGLYFGVRAYRDGEKGGVISFLEALIEGFKILVFGGIIAVAFAIIYVSYVSAMSIADFSGQIFGALLLGLLFSLAVALLVMNKHKAI